MTAPIQVEFDGSLGDLPADVQRALKRAVKVALLANRKALDVTGRKAAVESARNVAALKGVNQRPVRKRIRHYLTKGIEDPHVRLWAGIKTALSADQIGAKALKSIKARTFTATMPSGYRGQFVRRIPGIRHTAGRPKTSSPNLPIDKPSIRLGDEIRPVMLAAGRTHMKKTYPAEMTRDYRRRLKAIQSK